MKVLFYNFTGNVEDAIRQKLIEEGRNVGETFDMDFSSSPEKLLKDIEFKNPDILIFKENSFKKDSSNPNKDFELLNYIQKEFVYMDFRIILITSREPGDEKLGYFYAAGVYDILPSITSIQQYVDKIMNPTPQREAMLKYHFAAEEAHPGYLDKEKENVKKTNYIFEKSREKEILAETLEKKTIKHVEVKDEETLKELEEIKRQLAEKEKQIKSLEKNKKINSNKTKQQEDEQKRKEVAEKKKYDEELRKIKEKNNKLIQEKKKLEQEKALRLKKQKRTEDILKNTSKNKIISFYGAKNGLGTSSTAFSVSLDLANRKKKVLYIEYNDFDPSVYYWLGVDTVNNSELGIDKAILGIETNSAKDINDSILTLPSLKKNKPEWAKQFNKFPPNLDFLFFSNEYLNKKLKEPISSNSFTQLLVYLLQQFNYDYIILDINTRTNTSIIQDSLTYSNQNFLVISQEVSVLGYLLKFIDNLELRGLDFKKRENGKKSLKDKNSYILNKYQKGFLTKKDVAEFIGYSSIFEVVENGAEINESALNIKPFVLSSANRVYKENIKEIVRNILMT